MNLSGKIGVTEVACLLFISNIARIFLSFPQSYAEKLSTAAWLGALLSALGGLFIFLLSASIMKKFPRESLVEATKKIWGPYLGTLVNLIYAITFLVTVPIFHREFGEAMLASTLPRAPISIVIGVFALASLSTLFFNLEALARTARLVTPFILAGFVLLVVLALPDINVHNYLPLLGAGPEQILWLGLVQHSVILDGLLAALLLPLCQGWQHMRRAGFYGVLAGGLVLTIFVAIFQGVFNFRMAAEEILPLYVLARNIELGRHVQRIEAIFYMAWAMVGFIKVAICLYAGAVIFSKSLKLPDFRPVLVVGLLLTYALSFWPPDLPTVIEIDRQYRLILLLPVLALPLLTYVLSLFKKEQAKP